MNIRRLSALLLAATLCGSAPLFAASESEIPASFSIQTVTVASGGGLKFERGDLRSDVMFAMKNKLCQRLSHNVWAYDGFFAENAHSDLLRRCETLVVTFENDRVVDVQLVNKPAFAAIAANVKLDQSQRKFASR
jgi:hypothetical protein